MTTRQGNLYHLDADQSVLTSSITSLGIGTADLDADGYLDTRGINRSLDHGITSDGLHLIWMETNGDPVVVPDDDDALADWCHAMGDAGDSRDDRIATGAERLRKAVTMLQERYHHNDAALEDLDWFGGKADEALALISTG